MYRKLSVIIGKLQCDKLLDRIQIVIGHYFTCYTSIYIFSLYYVILITVIGSNTHSTLIDHRMEMDENRPGLVIDRVSEISFPSVHSEYEELPLPSPHADMDIHDAVFKNTDRSQYDMLLFFSHTFYNYQKNK